MKSTEAARIKILMEVSIEDLEKQNINIGVTVRKQVLNVQEDKKKCYNLRRGHSKKYKIRDLVVPKRTRSRSSRSNTWIHTK